MQHVSVVGVHLYGAVLTPVVTQKIETPQQIKRIAGGAASRVCRCSVKAFDPFAHRYAPDRGILERCDGIGQELRGIFHPDVVVQTEDGLDAVCVLDAGPSLVLMSRAICCTATQICTRLLGRSSLTSTRTAVLNLLQASRAFFIALWIVEMYTIRQPVSMADCNVL